MKINAFIARILSAVTVASCFALTSPMAMAATEEAEEAPEPVWVLSYASFLIFGGLTVFLCVFFSRRNETILSLEEQKKAGETRNARAKEHRKREMYERVHGQKKH